MTGGAHPFASGGAIATLVPTAPPPRGFRVIPGRVWWSFIFPQWRLYIAARNAVIPATPPTLGHSRSAGFYFTDLASLQGQLTPAAIAHRLSLYSQTQLECQLHGCAVVEFDVPPQVAVPAPSYPGTPAGLTTNGAREWMTTANLSLDPSMTVWYIDPPMAHRQHWFDVPL